MLSARMWICSAMLFCLCCPSAALTLDNHLGLSKDELEELALTESMEDGDTLEAYLEQEENLAQQDEDLAQLEEEDTEAQDPKAPRRKTRKGGARRRRRRSMSPGNPPDLSKPPVKLPISKRVKNLEKSNQRLTNQVKNLKSTVKILVAAVDELENPPSPPPTTTAEPLPSDSRSACRGKKSMEECAWAYYSSSRKIEGLCHPMGTTLSCRKPSANTKACLDKDAWDNCTYYVGTRPVANQTCMAYGYNNNTALACRQPRSTELACKPPKAHGDTCTWSGLKGKCYGSGKTPTMYCKTPNPQEVACDGKNMSDTCTYKHYKYGGRCGKVGANKLRCYAVGQSTKACDDKKADDDCHYSIRDEKKNGVCKYRESRLYGPYHYCHGLLPQKPNATAACNNKTLGDLCQYIDNKHNRSGGCVTQKKDLGMFCKHMSMFWIACADKKIGESCETKYNNGTCRIMNRAGQGDYYGLKDFISCQRR